MSSTIGFLLFPDVEELDFIGPWEVLSIWAHEFNGPSPLVTISQQGGTITCAKGLQVVCSHSFDNCPPLNTLVVPGGMGTRSEVNNHALIAFIKKTAPACSNLLSVCTGAFLLQAAGLLDGKKATTHWASLQRLKAFSQTSTREERFVNDGHIWSSAGIAAGIDMALAFVANKAGEDIAGKIQSLMEYYPSPKLYGNFYASEDAPDYLKR